MFIVVDVVKGCCKVHNIFIVLSIRAATGNRKNKDHTESHERTDFTVRQRYE